MADDLWHDVTAMDKISKDLAVPEALGGFAGRDVTAVERGERTRPDGTVESYERIEFD